jgi:small subunit ribosomal protein S7
MLTTHKNRGGFSLRKKHINKRWRALAYFRKHGEEPNLSALGRRKIYALSTKWNKDLFYRSIWVNKLMKKIMTHGKKSQTEKVLAAFLKEVNQICHGRPDVIFHAVLEGLRPALTVVLRRVGRRFYQIPVPIKSLRQYSLVLKWLYEATKNRERAPIHTTLTEEFINAYFFRKSEAFRKKEQLAQLVIKNRAFDHYRWI